MLSNWRYGKVATLENVAPSVYKVKVRTPAQSGKAPCSSAPRWRSRRGDNVTVVAYLVSGDPFLQAFDDDVVFTDIGEVILQVRHAAKAPKVDAWANGTEITPGDGIARVRSSPSRCRRASRRVLGGRPQRRRARDRARRPELSCTRLNRSWRSARTRRTTGSSWSTGLHAASGVTSVSGASTGARQRSRRVPRSSSLVACAAHATTPRQTSCR